MQTCQRTIVQFLNPRHEHGRQQLLHERERLLHLLQHPDHPVVLVHVGDGALQGQLGAELDAGRVLAAEVGLKRRKAA